MNILITDYFSPGNRGDAAIVEGMISALEDEFEAPKFHMLSSFPHLCEFMHGCAGAPSLIPWMRGPVGKLRALYLLLWARAKRAGMNLPILSGELRETLKEYLDADIVISKGGGHITSIYGDTKYRLVSLLMAKLLGKKVVIYAQSLGPFEGSFMKWLVRCVLNRVDLITTREQESADIVESVGVDPARVTVAADAALSMNPEGPDPSAIGQTALKDDSFEDGDRPIVTISVREWKKHGSGVYQDYLSAIADVADHLIQTRNCRIIFASTCTPIGGYHADDRMVACEVISRMQEDAEILWTEQSPYTLCNFLSHAELHVGTRMHSNILALLAGTPVFAIAYEHKSIGLMRQLGMQDHCTWIDAIEPDDLISRVEAAFNHRSELAGAISKALPDLARRARNIATMVADLVRD
ncbi:MAG: polysaccharide pyruvyl transferase family protein [Armatimonadota bacterium]